MPHRSPLTILCIATYLKGHEFIRECRRQGCRVLLLTTESLRGADWPREAVDEFYYMPRDIARLDLFKAVSHVARSVAIDRIVALDDYDVETAAALREHLRVPGMGETTARYFRDKLAMRLRGQTHGLPVPEFVHVLNDERVRSFTETVPPPWMLKPRSQAAAIGMRKIERIEDLWPALDALGDRRSFYLLERFAPGSVYHVDALVWERQVVFESVSRYGAPPYSVAHQGGVFTTRTLPQGTEEWRELTALAREVIAAFGLVRGVTHSEFIQADADNRWLFLETSARVGGAYIVDVIEAATGVNLWREWAKIEIAGEEGTYTAPAARELSAGLALTLARQEHPDTSAYTDPEVVYRVAKPNHAGLIVASPDPTRVETLLEQYATRFLQDFYATAPAPEKPAD